jgi:hypothetical protein
MAAMIIADTKGVGGLTANLGIRYVALLTIKARQPGQQEEEPLHCSSGIIPNFDIKTGANIVPTPLVQSPVKLSFSHSLTVR